MSRAHDLAVDAILAVYRAHATGGKLHVMLDDWNLDDATLQTLSLQDGLSQAEQRCVVLLAVLTESDRRVVLAAAEAEMGKGHE